MVLGTILLIVFGFTFKGLKDAQRRARDSGRRSDLGAISDALHGFYEDYGFFPPSEEGKVKMCKGEGFDEVISQMRQGQEMDFNKLDSVLKICEWGEETFEDIIEDSGKVYLARIPVDPRNGQGISYLYLSNTRRFQIYSYLEGGDREEGYNQGIVKRGLKCGSYICSFGKSFGETPLDKSIDDYEFELNRKLNTGK